MNPVDRDDEFELRLQRKERFVPQFDTDLDGPDEAVDRAVLARARATLLQPPVAPPRFHRAPRWTVPLALAATVLLSFTLVMQMDSRDVIAQRTAERADGATRAADGDVPAGVAESAMQKEMPVLANAPAETAAAEVAPVQVAPLEVAPVPAVAAPPVVMSAPRAAPSPPPALPPAPAAPPVPAPAPVAAMDAVAAPPAPRRAAAAESVADSAVRREALGATAASPGGTETIAAWLARIEALRAAGDLDGARRELAAFRNQHPDTELPPALRPLLEP
jgi:hypothetical protein